MSSPFPLVRNVADLRNRSFDLLVVGGGIYGAWTAYDAALRGLSVALIERKDWAAGTSSSSSKLIHGGLRYLEHYEFALVRHALIERRVLSHIGPHLVRPLNFMVPVWKGARVSRLQLLAGLTLYDFMATGKQPVPRFKSFSRRRLQERHPQLAAEGLRGGLRYGDCQEDDARMTLFVVAAAQGAGVVCANRVEAVALPQTAGGDVPLRDVETGEQFNLRARCIVNTAGPWAKSLVGADSPKVKLVKGIHLVLPAIEAGGQQIEDALLLTAPQDGRVFFVIPWYGRTLLGTTEAEVADPADAVVTPAESAYLLEAVKALLPGLGWTQADVIGGFAGVRTLQDDDTADLAAVSREFAILEPRPAQLWPVGGKYTTARCDSVEIVDRVQQVLGQAVTPSTTHKRALPGAPMEAADLGDFTGWQAEALPALLARGIDSTVAHFLTQRHGTRVTRIHQLIDENPAWGQRLHPQAPFLAAEAVLAIRDEMARDAEDVLRRRMPLNLLVREREAMKGVVEEMFANEQQSK